MRDATARFDARYQNAVANIFRISRENGSEPLHIRKMVHPTGFEPVTSAFGGVTNIVTPANAIASFSYLSHYPSVIFLL
jgi:hypothetical protein